MSIPRILGVVMIAVGVVLIVVGVNASNSVADSLSTAVTGHVTDGTFWYTVGGGVSALLGLFLAFGVVGSKKK